MTVDWCCGMSIDVTGLRVRVIILGSRMFLRLGFHLVGISFCACGLRRIRSGRRATFEAGELLHPCREGSAAALTICTFQHIG